MPSCRPGSAVPSSSTTGNSVSWKERYWKPAGSQSRTAPSRRSGTGRSSRRRGPGSAAASRATKPWNGPPSTAPPAATAAPRRKVRRSRPAMGHLRCADRRGAYPAGQDQRCRPAEPCAGRRTSDSHAPSDAEPARRRGRAAAVRLRRPDSHRARQRRWRRRTDHRHADHARHPPPRSPPARPSPATRAAAAARSPLDGVVETGVEPGCKVLTAGGTTYQVLGEDVPVGVPVRVTGVLQPGVLTTCQQGTPIRVTKVQRR